MKPILAAAILQSLILLSAPAAAQDSAARAAAVATQVMDGLGGSAEWAKTRYLRFDFVVEVKGKIETSRSHLWDRFSGRYRLTGKDRSGKTYLVLMNVQTQQGSAWLDGKPAEGEELKKLLTRGYAIWINDTYWLLMPYKLKDPGVQLTWEREAKEGASVWDVLALSFAGVGLTPNDRYWVFVNRSTHLVDRWEYILQDEKGPATRFDWRGWQRYGGIRLAAERDDAADQEKILFPGLGVPAAVPDAAFTSPEWKPDP